ncbi:B12-binding domain-containing radical SAM protein [Natranaerofaba carboxydovora]|uniref:B12-binding domain-containing radical SAM protein n=1 Tax=Natranaerofaba carboxydovora TaxID=2742683 RepID=UPI001F14573F|nr:radical SAM protein [Natranaerofaba carboxydovora]UMZ72612.1 Hopanoid C-3 methylase [Natranaerofaba carboxydovora]
MMRILLVRVNQNSTMGFRDLMQVEPLGLLMIAGVLKEHEVKIVDFANPGDIKSIVTDFQPDMCGISCSFTVDYDKTITIAKEIKSESKETFIFIGGHHAATKPEHFASNYVDALVIGEGEETIKELVSTYENKKDFKALKELKEVNGLVINEGGSKNQQYHTTPRSLIKDLNNLPYPRRDLVAEYRPYYYLGLRRPAYALETARGCPYKCKFCSVWRFYRSSYRLKSAKRVFEEIVSMPGDTILVTDDNFFASIERAYRIGELLKEAGIKKYFSIQARSDDIVRNIDLIDLWREVGLSSVFIGFEQIDQQGLNNLDKRNTIKNNEEALFALRNRGINVTSSLIVNPSYSENDFEVMLSYIKEKEIRAPSFSVLTPLPGTILYEEEKDRILTEDFRLYDLLHVVLPTNMPLENFYQNFARLWKESYKQNIPRIRLNSTIRDVLLTPSNWLHSVKLLRGMKCMFDANNYLLDHN